MKSAAAQRLRLLAGALSVLVLLAALAAAWFWHELKLSLPQLDGTAALPGLTAPVAVERDALGTPTIRGANRADVARALGFLHAQDRFFQMDLLRRHAAGELAELFGKSALAHDKSVRVYGFRDLAREVLRRLPPEQRSLLDAYAAGVNAGLAALPARPFEYLVLRTRPAPWRPEDCVLVSYAMTLDLQDAGLYEHSLATLRDTYGEDAVNFFAPLLSPDDAALDGSTAPLPPIPSAKIIDLRAAPVSSGAPAVPPDPPAPAGSNAFALSGAHTADGGALLANDMHLALRVPNIWYRASLVWPAAPDSPPSGHRVTGLTLPGTPALVAGSNGHIAWGFTNSCADTSDLVVVALDPAVHSLYQCNGLLAEIGEHDEIIRVKGSDPVTITVDRTQWGPIVGTDASGHTLALHWIALDPDATNFNLMELETARTASAALAIANRAGIPAQNFVVADADGAIGWTIAGRLPKRVGFSGRLPVSWAYGDRRWDGLLPPDEVPRILAPASGRIWSANQRMLGGDALKKIGDGGYARPWRARQIRDDLAGLEHAAPRDLLAIQLDDRAVFLTRWQKLLLATLTPAAVAGKNSRAELRRLVENWDARADVDSVGYRLVREFHDQTARLVLTPIFAPCTEADPNFSSAHFNTEPALWAMLAQKPPHLLNPKFTRWDDLLLAAADAVTANLERENIPLADATWGRRNTARIEHPFSRFLPGPLARLLDLPADPLPGDADLPRVQSPDHGASERFVVSPGREAEGIFEMPGGESGHPLSPFYRAGHEAWVHGNPTPFLPGKTLHTLELKP